MTEICNCSAFVYDMNNCTGKGTGVQYIMNCTAYTDSKTLWEVEYVNCMQGRNVSYFLPPLAANVSFSQACCFKDRYDYCHTEISKCNKIIRKASEQASVYHNILTKYKKRYLTKQDSCNKREYYNPFNCSVPINYENNENRNSYSGFILLLSYVLINLWFLTWKQ